MLLADFSVGRTLGGKDGFLVEQSFCRRFSKLLDIYFLVKLHHVPFQSQRVNPSAYRYDSAASPPPKVEEMATVRSLPTLLPATFEPPVSQTSSLCVGR